MKIKTLAIQNFKAFGPEQRFDFDSENVLIYGNNGSGKSSVYYALYTFLQSSSPGKNWQKYFDQTHAECLENKYTDSTQFRSFVRLTT
ncbi:AAA family ATPase, partial [Nostoc sp. CHAB 5834]|nr:AAA family ATPase [Nostoc sp. CHAB 5834]